jgi:hypothetical protein
MCLASPWRIGLIVSDGYRFQAVKLEPLDSKIKVAGQLRALADNIERDQLMGVGDNQSPAIDLTKTGFLS